MHHNVDEVVKWLGRTNVLFYAFYQFSSFKTLAFMFALVILKPGPMGYVGSRAWKGLDIVGDSK
jgi:hypothetical protein